MISLIRCDTVLALRNWSPSTRQDSKTNRPSDHGLSGCLTNRSRTTQLFAEELILFPEKAKQKEKNPLDRAG